MSATTHPSTPSASSGANPSKGSGTPSASSGAPKKPRPKVAHTYGAKDISRWSFEENTLPEPWASHLCILPKRFTMYVDGDPGHGKTEYQIQIARVLAEHFGKVRLNNVEQGKHVQIKASVMRNDIASLKGGKFAYCSISNFEKYVEQLKRPNSGRVQIIDSISFFPLSEQQIQKLFTMFPNKSFILVAYKAHFAKNAEIRHLCDIKVRVENFVAHNNGSNRMGGTADHIIWQRPKKTNGQLSLMQPLNEII